MEEIVTCNICAQQFDRLHFIPKMLECGHTFCSPCLTKVFQKNLNCPCCRARIKGEESSLPINYYTLKVVDIYMSKRRSKSEILTTIEVTKRKENISKKINQLTSSLELLVDCLEKLDDLTMSESQRVDNVKVKQILNEVDEDLRKTDMCFDCSKHSVLIHLSAFQDTKEYLEQIYKRVQNKEKVFAVGKIKDKLKYGKVSKYAGKLLFHSLTLLEVPTDSALIWFDELKQCTSVENFYTFLEICCNKRYLTRKIIIKMFDEQQSHQFIKFCTGECGPSYKGTSFGKGFGGDGSESILNVGNFAENSRQYSRAIDYNFCTENVGFYKCVDDEMFLGMSDEIGNFVIFLAKKNFESRGRTVGRIISPTNLKKHICYEDFSFLKILDCGIVLDL